MRTKSKGVIDRTTELGTYSKFRTSNDSRVFGPGTLSAPRNLGETHVITYDNSKMRERNRTRSCDHQVVISEGKRVSEAYYTPDRLYYFTANWWYVHDEATSFPITLPDVSAYHALALDFFKSGCQDQKIDLALNLLEWKQVKSLLPDLRSTFQGFTSALRSKSVKQTLKSSANTHLLYSFGIKPLVADVEGFVKSVMNLTDHVTWLRKQSGKRVRVDFRKDVSSSSCPANRTWVNNDTEVGYVLVKEYRATYHAFATVTYDVSQLTDLELKLRSLTRSFGLDKPLSVLWNHLPWTFVIDWVFKVGRLIEGITPAITLPVRFHDLGYSVKVLLVEDKVLTRRYPKSGSTSNSVRVSRSRYTRFPGLPISFSSLSDDDLSLRQLALSMSLALQKWR